MGRFGAPFLLCFHLLSQYYTVITPGFPAILTVPADAHEDSMALSRAEVAMSNTQFSGPVFSNNGFRVGSYYNSAPVSGSNNTTNSPVASVMASQTQALTVTAVTNTDTTITVPTGARVTGITAYVTTAFTGGTPTIALGNAAGGAQYVAATSLATGGVYVLTFAATTAAATGLLSFPGTLYVRINQASAPTAVGNVTLAINYVI